MARVPRLHLTPLEERLAPAAGDLLRTLAGSVASGSFGRAVAADGDLVVAGGGGTKALVYNAVTGALVSTLQVSGAGIGGFGSAVAISGNRVVVGAQSSNIGSGFEAGKAFVFDATSGALLATLSNPSPTSQAHFGASVDIDGDRVVVGTSIFITGDADAPQNAYLFDTGGALLATFTNPARAEADNFGNAVAISGTRVVVGAPYDDPAGQPTSAGAVFVFDAVSKALVGTVLSPQPQAAGAFGIDVALDGNTLLVGEFQAGRPGFDTVGAAYVYDLTNPAAPVLRTTLDHPAPVGGDRFGSTVGVSGSRAVVGVGRTDGGAVATVGAAYLYELSAASPATPLATLASPTTTTDRFGSAVAVSGGRTLVGALQADPGGVNNAGAVYVFGDAGTPPPPSPPSIPIANFATGGSPDGSVQVARLSGLTTVASGIGGAVRTATADINGDGVLDTIAGAGPGGASRVVVINGQTGTPLAGFDVFEAAFTGGVFVTAADLNGDGRAEVIVTPDQGGGPVVAIYDGANLTAGANADSQLIRFLGIDDPNFRGGARPALGDINGDGRADLLIAAGFGGGPRLAIFDGKQVFSGGGGIPPKLVGDFFVFEDTLRNGVFVGAGDLTADGAAEVVVGGGPGGAPRVFALNGRDLVGGNQTPVVNFFAGDSALRGGVRVAVQRGDDGKPTLVTGSGENEAARVRVYRPATALAGGAPDQELSPFGGAVLANGVFVG